MAHDVPSANCAPVGDALGSAAVEVEVCAEDAGKRADAVLPLRLAGAPTRSRVQRAIKDGGVLLNGAVLTKTSAKVRKGDRLTWLRDAAREAPGSVEPEAIELTIYHEDDDCIALEKPAGMSVHPAGGLRSGTLVSGGR